MPPMPNPRPLDFDAIAEARRQWEARDWGAPAAMSATTSIMRAQQICLATMDEVLRPFDLTFARYEALVLLAFSRQGALPLGKMGDRLMLHPTSVTNIIDRLERQELVRRVAHPTGARSWPSSPRTAAGWSTRPPRRLAPPASASPRSATTSSTA